MNNRVNTILLIFILFLTLTIPPVVAINSYGSFTDRASSGNGAFTVKSTENGTIWFFEAGKTAPIWSYNLHGETLSAAISPDNNYIAVGFGGGLIWLFDQKGTVLWNKSFGNAGIKSIVFSKDSQHLDASSFMNQAFYISIQGNPATRPAPATITAVPSVTPAVTLAQIPTNLDLSWIESFFRNNPILFQGIIIGLIIAGIAWYSVSRKWYRQRGKSGSAWDLMTLKNFTIFSLLLILAGFLPSLIPFDNYQGLFQAASGTGIFCFILAYFLYAVKCWGADGQVCAVLMVSVPLFTYFLATSKIPGSTTNMLFYLAIQFCFYAIISTILLYVCDMVKTGIEGLFSGRTRRYHGFFTPDTSYAVIGVVIVSFLMVNYGGAALFAENSGAVIHSFQKPISPQYSPSGTGTASVSSQNIPLPTLEPDIVKSIESSVGNAPPAIDISALEMEIHSGINQQRKSNGLSPLGYDTSLASIARKHSADMAQNNYFSHDNLQGLDPSARAARNGYSCYKNYGSYYTTGLAENIMQNNLYDSVTYYNGIPRYDWNSQEEIARSTVSGWMTSSGHRQNILTPTYGREGIGVAIASDDKVYITEDFC